MANQEHVELLINRCSQLRKWKLEHPDEALDLEGADLKEANLTDANLRSASLSFSNLERANLYGAFLYSASLYGVNLKGADLTTADLSGADLTGCNLEEAKLCRANLKDAILVEANLKNADLTEAKLGRADLARCNIEKAKLCRANLEDAILVEANLKSADLRQANGLILSSTFTRNAHFDTRAQDPWSILRRTYSGPRLMFNLLALVAFVVPYFGTVLFWASVNRTQSYTEIVVREQAGVLGLASETITNFSRCLADKCEPMQVWELIIGVDKGWSFWAVAVMLISYNVLKAGLTWIVAPMRDEEERSGYTPNWKGKRWWNGYRPLFWAHNYVVVGMFWASVFAFLSNALYWLSQTVWIPD